MPIQRLIGGYKKFRAEIFPTKKKNLLRLAAEGQHPEVCMIACSDSRVMPETVMRLEPGQVFSIRNVANLVPPYREEERHYETGAALEYAVQVLKVKHVVVLGHTHCGGIRALMGDAPDTGVDSSFIPGWISLAEKAKRGVMASRPEADPETRQRICERDAILVSLENLTTYPWINAKVQAGEIALHGWYIDIATADIQAFNPKTDRFEAIDVIEALGA